MVGEQPYKNRDMVGSDPGLGHLLVSSNQGANVILTFSVYSSIPLGCSLKLSDLLLRFKIFCEIAKIEEERKDRKERKKERRRNRQTNGKLDKNKNRKLN